MTKPTAKGSYQVAEVIYKNLSYNNKVENKQVFSFGAQAAAFKALAEAQPNATFEVEVKKNQQGYNDWTAVKPSNGNPEPKTTQGSTGAQRTSTYETPEERAQRQVFIIRQSSLGHAISTLSVGAKSVKADEAIKVAEQFTNWVMGIKDPGPSGFDDLPDFDPSFTPQVD